MCVNKQTMNEITTVKDCIFHLLSKASRAGTRLWKQDVAEFGVTPVQAKVLAFLRELDNPTSVELGEVVSLDSATLTGILDRLENMELLSRKPHNEDRRSVIIVLTQQGQALAEQLFEKVAPANKAFLKDLSREEAMMLRGILKRL